jgi:hypothetical protein
MYTRKTTGLFEIRHFKFCNVTLTYIDDVVSINDPNFAIWKRGESGICEF